jgi:hydrogenase 3 maturation protease
MNDLRHQLSETLRGRVCIVGVGNTAGGDDGAGVRLAEALANDQRRTAGAEWPLSRDALTDASREILVAGMSPERHLSRLAAGDFDAVLFLDAVECGALPGAVVLLDAAEMASRFPQVSTHRISLGLLAQMIEANGRTRVWLLGVQPASLKPGDRLSSAVATAVECLAGLLTEQPEEALT